MSLVVGTPGQQPMAKRFMNKKSARFLSKTPELTHGDYNESPTNESPVDDCYSGNNEEDERDGMAGQRYSMHS